MHGAYQSIRKTLDGIQVQYGAMTNSTLQLKQFLLGFLVERLRLAVDGWTPPFGACRPEEWNEWTRASRLVPESGFPWIARAPDPTIVSGHAISPASL